MKPQGTAKKAPKKFLKKKKQFIYNEEAHRMSAKETIGAITVLIFGLMVFFGIQFLSSTQTIGGTTFLLSYVGVILILLGVVLTIWFIANKIK